MNPRIKQVQNQASNTACSLLKHGIQAASVASMLPIIQHLSQIGTLRVEVIR